MKIYHPNVHLMVQYNDSKYFRTKKEEITEMRKL